MYKCSTNLQQQFDSNSLANLILYYNAAPESRYKYNGKRIYINNIPQSFQFPTANTCNDRLGLITLDLMRSTTLPPFFK